MQQDFNDIEVLVICDFISKVCGTVTSERGNLKKKQLRRMYRHVEAHAFRATEHLISTRCCITIKVQRKRVIRFIILSNYLCYNDNDRTLIMFIIIKRCNVDNDKTCIICINLYKILNDMMFVSIVLKYV